MITIIISVAIGLFIGYWVGGWMMCDYLQHRFRLNMNNLDGEGRGRD